MWLIPQMISELDLHRALEEPLRQLREQPTRPDDLLLPADADEQLIDHPFGRGSRTRSGRSPTPGGLPASCPRALRCARPPGSLRETPAEPRPCISICVDIDISLLSTDAYTEARTLPIINQHYSMDI
jgi:hypothetical protein